MDIKTLLSRSTTRHLRQFLTENKLVATGTNKEPLVDAVIQANENGWISDEKVHNFLHESETSGNQHIFLADLAGTAGLGATAVSRALWGEEQLPGFICEEEPVVKPTTQPIINPLSFGHFEKYRGDGWAIKLYGFEWRPKQSKRVVETENGLVSRVTIEMERVIYVTRYRPKGKLEFRVSRTATTSRKVLIDRLSRLITKLEPVFSADDCQFLDLGQARKRLFVEQNHESADYSLSGVDIVGKRKATFTAVTTDEHIADSPEYKSALDSLVGEPCTGLTIQWDRLTFPVEILGTSDLAEEKSRLDDIDEIRIRSRCRKLDVDYVTNQLRNLNQPASEP